jgi:hypothetical protein
MFDELKQSLAAANEAKELLTTEHETMVQSMEESKLSLIQELTASKQQSRATIEELHREVAQVEAVSKDCGVLCDDSQQPSAEAATTDLLQIKVVELGNKVKMLKKGLLVAKSKNL